jgi:hypothetical protein
MTRSALGLALAALALATASACVGGSGTAASTASQSGQCAASRVRYDTNPAFPSSLRPLPYVSAASGGSMLAGHLFYYGLVPKWKRDDPPDFRIYTHGHVPGTTIQMKILWTLSGSQATHGLTVRGTRTDGAGSFTANFPGDTEFPSIISLPSPGCWRLALATRTTEHLTVLAVS